MTRPDVEALAAALSLPEMVPFGYDLGVAGHTVALTTSQQFAEAIIAALAASGWRITSAPEPSELVTHPAKDKQGSPSLVYAITTRQVVTGGADDPARAQGAPCPDCGPYAPCPRHDEAAQGAPRGVATGGNVLPQAAPDETWQNPYTRNAIAAIEQAAVRAALEGAIERVKALPPASGVEHLDICMDDAIDAIREGLPRD